jgi:leucyl-tRNA---protein transferase
MKYIFNELNLDSKDYQYPYMIYAKKEEDEDIDRVYSMGFLPTRIEKNLFYLSRNLRINLENFELTSENRRILKKVEGLEMESKSLENFEFSYDISKLAAEYFKSKFGKKIISTQKLKWLFESNFFTNILVYKYNGKKIGYCISMETPDLLHYAYPFYSEEMINSNIGMGMMLKAILYAKETERKYIYLGTVYTEQSQYKLQFKGLEWFDGQEWNRDINLLKEKIDEE